MRLSYALALGALTTTASAVDLQMSNTDIQEIWNKVNTLRGSMNRFDQAHSLYDDATPFVRNSLKSLTADSRATLFSSLDDAAAALDSMTATFQNYP